MQDKITSLLPKNLKQIAFLSLIMLQVIIIFFLSVSVNQEVIVLDDRNSVDKNNFSGNASSNYLADFRYNPDGPVEGIMKENKTAWITEGGRLPAYILDTNSKGFREGGFSTKKPDEKTRIVFVGNSQTMGWGVNESDRYTDLIENRLNEDYQSRNFQVINTAIPAYGFEDFQNILDYRVSSYDPDIVVIAGTRSSSLSLSDQKEINTEIEEEINYSDNSERFQIYNEKVQERLERTNLNEEFDKWVERWNSSVSKDTSLIYYAYAESSSQDPDYFSGVEEKYNITLITGPEDIWDDDNILSRDDPHFNSEGHALQAENLYKFMEKEIRNTS